jgi:hypothetical protein
MRETRQSGSEGGARFYPLSLPLSRSRGRFGKPEARRDIRKPEAYATTWWRCPEAPVPASAGTTG